MKTLTTLLLLFLTTSYALAEDASSTKTLKEYDIEIIIFEDAHARYLTSESWKQIIQTENLQAAEVETTEITEITEQLDDLSIEKIKTIRFQNIKPEILNKQYKRINVSSEYNVLFYGAWRQAGLAKSKAFEVNINELKNIHSNKSDNTLSGTFRLVLSRFLHIYNQLDYQRAVAHTNLEFGITGDDLYQFNVFPINSHRRMRSKKLHYIDHPLVGMLIQINPVEKTIEVKDQNPAAS